MRLQNFTSVETSRLKEIIRFVVPSGVSKFDISFKNSSRGWCARAYVHGSSYHEENLIKRGLRHRSYQAYTPLVVINVPPFSRYRKPNVSNNGGGYLRSVQFSHEEDIVHLVAHELRHLWQGKVKSGRRVWGARGQFSERDADAYAIRKVRQWRRLTAKCS